MHFVYYAFILFCFFFVILYIFQILRVCSQFARFVNGRCITRHLNLTNQRRFLCWGAANQKSCISVSKLGLPAILQIRLGQLNVCLLNRICELFSLRILRS